MLLAGCPDLYRVYPKHHMFQGVLRGIHTTLKDCQTSCISERNCIAVDWNMLDSTPTDQRCFFIFPESTRYGINPSPDNCCAHYRRTSCLSTVVTGATTPSLNSVVTTTTSTVNGLLPNIGGIDGTVIYCSVYMYSFSIRK